MKSAPEHKWSLFGMAKRVAPQATRESLDRALAELGPLTKPHDEKFGMLCPCASCTERSIDRAARIFNASAFMIDGAPRRKEVLDQMRASLEAAKNFSATLINFDNVARHQLRIIEQSASIDPFDGEYEAITPEQLPEPDTATKRGIDGPVVDWLAAYVRHVTQRIEQLEQSDGDKGGRTNFMREELGAPPAVLVLHCWKIFNKGRDVRGTAYENGAFARFLNAVHEFATGDPEENSTLLNWAKKLAKILRNHDEQVARDEASDDRFEFLTSLPKSKETDAAIAQLIAAKGEIEASVISAQLDLMRAMKPSRQRTAS